MVRKNQFIRAHPDKKEPIYLEPIHYAQKGWFCETCNQRKPRNNKPKVKGWKCCECERKRKMTTTQRIIKELHIMGAISEQTALNAKDVAELADTKQAHARLCELRDQGLVIASSRTGKNKYWLTLAGVQYAEKTEESKQDQENSASENIELTDAAIIDEAAGQANTDDSCLNCTQDSCGSCDEAKPIPLPQYNPDDVAFKKSDTVFWYTVDGIKEVFETSSDAIHAAEELAKSRKIYATVHAVASKPHAIIKPVVTTELEYL